MAGFLLGRMGRQATVQVAAGRLQVHWDPANDHVLLAGPAAPVYRGRLAQQPSLPR